LREISCISTVGIEPTLIEGKEAVGCVAAVDASYRDFHWDS
jgi:hypothetical protein